MAMMTTSFTDTTQSLNTFLGRSVAHSAGIEEVEDEERLATTGGGISCGGGGGGGGVEWGGKGVGIGGVGGGVGGLRWSEVDSTTRGQLGLILGK